MYSFADPQGPALRINTSAMAQIILGGKHDDC